MSGELSVLKNELSDYQGRSNFMNSKETCSLPYVESANKLIDLDRLLSTMIHQIRNHCVTIKGYTSMLNYEEGISDKGFKWLSKISRGVGSLEYFLKDFEKYRISKIQKNELVNVNLSVKQVWSNLIDTCNIDTNRIHVNFNIAPAAVLYADRNNFIKMLYHIIKNAVESIDKDGMIEIDFSNEDYGGENTGDWVLEIRDSG
jgi:signal transduction histidine kinase